MKKVIKNIILQQKNIKKCIKDVAILNILCYNKHCIDAPVAQLDRATAF